MVRKSSRFVFFFFLAEEGIRVLVRFRGLGDMYKGQMLRGSPEEEGGGAKQKQSTKTNSRLIPTCFLYTSDAADDLPGVDLGGRRFIKKKNYHLSTAPTHTHKQKRNSRH